MRRTKIDLRTELEPNLPMILGDRIQLQQVLLNLILNAKDAMTTVACPRKLLVKSQRDESGQIVVAVCDSGVGMDSKDVARIFDPFFTTKSEGMGLGLSISRTIIEDHGGVLWVTPNKDQGLTFQFSLTPSQ